MNAAMKNTRIEFHILQSFPVSCLNRDDVGAPKSAMVGGVNRARVSSQCWKRQVRLEMQNFGIKLGLRTKKVAVLMEKACLALEASEEAAKACAEKIAKELADDTLLFISDTEAEALASYAKENNFDASKIKVKDLAKRAQKALNPAFDALDIALFGRMVAKATDMNIEAAASFSHAISTHKVTNEVEFFTALDDCQEEQGSAHMGSLEFNAATYYRYISLDLGQLAQTLGNDEMEASAEQLQQAIEAFTKALFVALPSARQTTQSGASPWEFAQVLVRRGQRLQVPFETPIKPEQGGYIQPSITALKTYLQKKESMTGSLFGKLGAYEWGENEDYSIDALIADLKTHVE
ncbi:type I-E CRISPR-associated protein Cas7/Cse4/CasC [Vibrio vulnificus]|uniref:type I-E CRISPR-associated protein Cas7/Cse4/CasC n=1 Tax=Vibrio vulnificus TaxID=672 RepID=UPI00102C6B38|nr:type I-E CRISPR-associated protein Cas7/Cse4/CasC [Vibrio vulnificus]EIA0806494.1 type I-E CRISPR-associated protein Cas7/Cse4/CasC [Vibrio vulnificus]EJN6713285.1 type I-E CRISPR-associated protein Cas7/Cse4/CasC [Vibrio vulnificus]MCU8269055.1 type I-E CRISPR-associated protein Cas7/Cse4/CasC [Vibrio vulnificus]RZR41761.1 type I-E CRISPR-associated protein Cas7/Cse4/CasC [Vibrio vulnificus]